MRLMSRFPILIAGLAALVLAAACGGDDDTDASPAPTEAGSLTASPTIPAVQNPITPPLEGPDRGPAATERTDFREDPAFRLPSPDDVPGPLEDDDDPLLFPPEEPICPEGWETVNRPSESFEICHPPEWSIEGQGYVSAGQEERWYSMGIVDFENEEALRQRAHVSVYVIPQFARPFPYTRDCPQPYSVEFTGRPAVACTDFPGTPPEAFIASYHVFANDIDYFVNVVPYFQYEGGDGEFTDEIYEESLATAREIAFSFRVLDATPGPTE